MCGALLRSNLQPAESAGAGPLVLGEWESLVVASGDIGRLLLMHVGGARVPLALTKHA